MRQDTGRHLNIHERNDDGQAMLSSLVALPGKLCRGGIHSETLENEGGCWCGRGQGQWNFKVSSNKTR